MIKFLRHFPLRPIFIYFHLNIVLIRVVKKIGVVAVVVVSK